MGQSCCALEARQEEKIWASEAVLSDGQCAESIANSEADHQGDQSEAPVQPSLLLARVKGAFGKEEVCEKGCSQGSPLLPNVEVPAFPNLLQEAALQVEGGMDEWLEKWCSKEVLIAFEKTFSCVVLGSKPFKIRHKPLKAEGAPTTKARWRHPR
mmetsp:Transcript_1159/g.1296  ORF Transcript_1159/g.1296 Transcript_1159/m.1296 type:complete len:155 (+) Transcript_1159:70-534(+)